LLLSAVVNRAKRAIKQRQRANGPYEYVYPTEKNDIKMKQLQTSGQSNLTTGRIASAHGRFTNIGQMAPVCTPT